MVETFNGYKELNERMLDWVCSMSEEDLKKCQYNSSQKDKEVPLMSFETSTRASEPVLHHFEKKLFGVNTMYNVD